MLAAGALVLCSSAPGCQDEGAWLGGQGIETITRQAENGMPVPRLECVAKRAGGTLGAIFGYENPSSSEIDIPVGPSNELSPARGGPRQPTKFLPGRHRFVFNADFSSTLTWKLAGTAVTANKDSKRCQELEACTTAPGPGAAFGDDSCWAEPLPAPPSFADAIDRPEATSTAGKLDGSFEVTDAGGAAHTIDLWTPAPRNGLGPKLQVAYRSDGGGGLLGPRFSLTGLSRITRCPKTLVPDNTQAPIRFDDTDSFCLDNDPLRLVSGENARLNAVYATFPDQFAKITIMGNFDPAGPRTFEVRTKNGLIYTYGEVADRKDALLDDDSHQKRYALALSRVADRAGNYMDYFYERKGTGLYVEIVPKEIQYTGFGAEKGRRSVKFITQPVADPVSTRTKLLGGLGLMESRVLKRLEMTAPHPDYPKGKDETKNELVRAYVFDYELGPARESRLSKIRECSAVPTDDSEAAKAAVCKRPTVFTWAGREERFTQWTTDSNGQAILDVYRNDSPDFARQWTLQPVDLNADGRDDILYRNGRRWTYRQSVRTETGFALGPATELNIAAELESDTPYDLFVTDLNKDGLPDLAAVRPGKNGGTPAYSFYQGDGSAFTEIPTDDGGPDPETTDAVGDLGLMIGDVDGDGCGSFRRHESRYLTTRS